MVLGVPITITHTHKDIENAIIKCNGVLTHIAHELGLSRLTLYNYIREKPEMWELVDKERKNGVKYGKSWECDRAKTNIQRIMEKVDDYPSAALKACMYVMDNSDEYYGYGKKNEPQKEELEKDFDKFMMMLEERRQVSLND